MWVLHSYSYVNMLFTECVDGKYGDGCQSDCGHCDNLTHCHHVNGTCVSGCLPGYRLDHCQERKYTNISNRKQTRLSPGTSILFMIFSLRINVIRKKYKN